MENIIDSDNYKNALSYIAGHFGLKAQLRKLKEELSELDEAISTYSESEDLDHLLEEIVDVNLVTAEVIILLSYKYDIPKQNEFSLADSLAELFLQTQKENISTRISKKMVEKISRTIERINSGDYDKVEI